MTLHRLAQLLAGLALGCLVAFAGVDALSFSTLRGTWATLLGIGLHLLDLLGYSLALAAGVLLLVVLGQRQPGRRFLSFLVFVCLLVLVHAIGLPNLLPFLLGWSTASGVWLFAVVSFGLYLSPTALLALVTLAVSVRAGPARPVPALAAEGSLDIHIDPLPHDRA
jgi:hypothetical protein